MNRTKQLTIGMAAALVLLGSTLLTTGLLWLKQRISQDSPSTEDTLAASSEILATIPQFEEPSQPPPTPAFEVPNPSFADTPEFVLLPTLNDEK